MGYANVITGLITKILKLLAMVIPLSILALISIMTVQAYNKMINIDFGGNFEVVSPSVEIETGRLVQSTRPGR